MSVANKILMIRPASFAFNPQTEESNSFQKRVDLTAVEIQTRALQEFDAMAKELERLGIDVLVLQDEKKPDTPDAIFPNNWFSTHPDGEFCLYPMEAKTRRLERRPDIIDAVKNHSYIGQDIDLTGFEVEGKFLEGTGSLVIDHENKIAYACISSRTNPEVLKLWGEKLGFEIVKFYADDQDGHPIYHTNVMMCMGNGFAVICLDSITDPLERALVSKNLAETGKEIVEISFEQMINFAGNMLLLGNQEDEKILVMSKRAFDSLQKAQIKQIESHAKIASFVIDTIEECGGGSVRCMIAELF